MRTVYLIAVLIAWWINCNQTFGQDIKLIFHSRSTLASRMESTSVTNLIGHKYKVSIKLLEVDLAKAKNAGSDMEVYRQFVDLAPIMLSNAKDMLKGLEDSGIVNTVQLPDVVTRSSEHTKEQSELQGAKFLVRTVTKVKEGDLAHTNLQLLIAGTDRDVYQETYNAVLTLGQTYLLKSQNKSNWRKTHWLIASIDEQDAK